MRRQYFSTFFQLLTIGVLLCAALAAGSGPAQASAVAQAGQPAWSQPANLSQSGSASDPVLAVDSQGVAHVMWRDQYLGGMYSRKEGQGWSAPASINPPFAGFQARLVAGPNGLLHAFWLDANNTLNYSSVAAKDLPLVAWSAVVQLAQSALDYDVAPGPGDRLNLAYLRPISAPDFPAGVYYRSFSARSGNWSAATLIYASPYFHSLKAEEANVSVAAAGRLYVAWDNRPRARVFLAVSVDEGESWGEAQEIDRPTADQPDRPLNIQVAAQGNEAFLFWQRGAGQQGCTLVFEALQAGSPGSAPKPLPIGGFNGCPEKVQLLNGPLLALSSSLQSVLLAWDGGRWSSPQSQPGLMTFSDPETYQPVFMGCLRLALASANELLAVGCDTSGGGDIWASSRSLGDTQSWFPSATTWKPPVEIPGARAEVSAPQLVAGSQGRLHAFWREAAVTAGKAAGQPSQSIFYSSWSGSRWSSPVEILKSPNGRVNRFVARFDPAGRLLAAWNDNETGQIFFSWANEQTAGNPLEWESPAAVPVSASPIGDLDLAVAPSGQTSLVYNLPLNERRGVYLVRSSDAGQTWEAPVQVFDGVAAGWAMVGAPHLLVSAEGVSFVQWQRPALPGSIGEQGLYFSRSTGAGAWSPAAEVTRAAVDWNILLDPGAGQLLRLWQEAPDGQAVVRYQTSGDLGQTWSLAESLPSFSQDQTLGLLSMAQEASGRPHLISQMLLAGAEEEIWHWMWDGSRWLLQEHKLRLSPDEIAGLDSISAAVSTDGQLGVVLSGPRPVVKDQPVERQIFFVRHPIDLLPASAGPQAAPAAPTAVATAAGASAALEEPLPAATQSPPELPAVPLKKAPVERQMLGILVGSGVAVLSVFFTISLITVLARLPRFRKPGN